MSTATLEATERLRQAVVDADELHRRVHVAANASTSSASSGGTFSSCAKRRAESNRIAVKVLECLGEFEKGMSMAGTRRFSNAKFAADAKLDVASDDLVKPNAASETEGLVRLQKAVQRLADVEAREVRKQAASSGQSADEATAAVSQPHSNSNFYATHRFLNERAPNLLAKCLELHKTAGGLNADTWAAIPDALLVLLDDIITSVPTDVVLADSEEGRKRLDFEVEELTHQQTEAIGDGDMKAAEQLYFKKVAVQESMVPLYEQMTGMLDEHHQVVVMEPAQRAQDVHARANSQIGAIAARNETRKKRLHTDLKALTGVHRQLSDEDRELRQRFVKLRQDSDSYLKENAGEIDRCYSAMEELERHVARLAGERSEALLRRLNADIQEAQRVCDLENFYAFSKQQKQLLETSIRSVDASDEVTDLFHELVSSGANAVGQRVKAIETEIEAARMRLHELRLSQFRQLYLTLGDLQYKKERNLEELDKKIEQVHIQQEIAMDTFNPKAKDLANAKKELLQVRDEMGAQIGVIHGKAQLQIEYFKPTEQALVDAGKQFVHPVEELSQKNEARQHKLLEYHQLMQQTSEDAASAELGGAPVEEELKQLEELRQKTSHKYHNSNKSPNKSARMTTTVDSENVPPSPPPPPPPPGSPPHDVDLPTSSGAGLD